MEQHISQEQARESLIAISYTSPEEEQEPLTSSDVKLIVTKRNSRVAERLRSELISIFYHDSPDEPICSTPPSSSTCRGY
ncbi:hypothetical protein HA466_0262920 [Hirschfeldia incana]|nr:hypothetical protein HA466_0262920 [Hirschfeldia incana]